MEKLFDKARVFVGSATESLGVARAIQQQLARDAHVEPWPDTEFKLTASTLSSLLEAARRYDFAIFVLTPDDVTYIRDRPMRSTRGNVIFELGMFLSAIGADRTYIVTPRGPDAPEPITDLLGITTATYDPVHFKENSLASLGDACERIRGAIQEKGLRASHYFASRYAERIRWLGCDESSTGSPLAAESLIHRANRELFFAAQNHHYILNRKPAIFKKVLFGFLDKGIKIRFIICDPENEETKAAWKTLFQKDNCYLDHLQRAYDELRIWVRDANGLPFEAKTVPLVPLSVNFIDPEEEEEGLAVFTPNVFEHISGVRPAYLLSKREHPNIFRDYWKAYEQAFENGRPVPPAP